MGYTNDYFYVSCTGQSKDGEKAPCDGKSKQENKQTARLVSSNTGLSVYGAFANFSTNISFKQNMNERKAKIKLFMMEGENGFENLSLKTKIIEMATRGDNNLRE